MLNPLLRFQAPRTFIQVGAHRGDDDLIRACRNWGHRAYLFEPIPKRVEELRAKTANVPTVEVLPLAVSNTNGKAKFHIAGNDDCSSLQEFDEKANQTWVHPYHPYRSFEMVEEIEVEVIRLDTFLAQRQIDLVDKLTVDAQGEDLRVVESLGARLRDVKKIQIEVNISGAPLYRNACTMAEAEAFFGAHNFERHVGWRQSVNREENVIFRNRRFYPYGEMNFVASTVEQGVRSTHNAAVKLPRVAAVARMKLMRSLGRKRGASN